MYISINSSKLKKNCFCVLSQLAKEKVKRSILISNISAVNITNTVLQARLFRRATVPAGLI
jgi:hypothetical protein